MSKYICIVCRKEFIDNPSHKRKYCSMKCRNTAYKYRKDYMPCEFCGKPVRQNRARLKKYCNRDCRRYAMKKRSLVPNKCEHCGELFYTTATMRKRKYCSYKCHTIKRYLIK